MIYIGSSTLLSGDQFAGAITVANPILISSLEFGNSIYDEIYIENAAKLKPYEIYISKDSSALAKIENIDESTFLNKINNEIGEYLFSYSEDGWNLSNEEINLTDYGITLKSSYYPFSGDFFTITISTVNTEIPEWGYDTVFDAKFENDAEAGNIKWGLDTVDGLLIKRQYLQDDGNYSEWISIFYKEIINVEDFNIQGQTDYTATTGTYRYAIVPVKNGIEGAYTTTLPISVNVNKLTLIDADKTAGKENIYSTFVTDGSCNTTYIFPSNTIETLYNRFPTIISNSNIKYQTIEVNASFYPDVCEQDIGIFDDSNRIRYIDKVLHFLVNGRPKVLKNVDGRMWLVWITTPPTDSAGEIYKFRNITFGCTEIGDIENEKYLYQYGFTNVPERYWNQ